MMVGAAGAIFGVRAARSGIVIQKGIHMKSVQQSFFRCLALAGIVLLGGCLPDDESVRERKLANFAATQAASYAASLSSFAIASQNNFAARLAQGTPAQGVINRSEGEDMATGYCVLPGTTPNHLLVTWFSTSDNDRNFSIKGLGTGTGASIVHALSQRALPETIGYYESGTIKLRGPRANGDTNLSLPCDMSIPSGAPIIITENVMAPATETVEGESYEYQTLACPDENDIGMLTQRRSVTTNSDGTIVRGMWGDYDTTCDGQVSVRSIEIVTGGSNNLIGALSGSAGSLRTALEGLQNVDCTRVGTRSADEDDGEDETIADSCNTDGIDIIEYTGPSLSRETGLIEGTERAEVQCGGEPAGFRSTNVVYGGASYLGTLNYAAWDGSAVYMRHVYRADYDEANNQGENQTSVRGSWVGDTIQCNRPETFNIACNAYYPAFNDTNLFLPVNTAGVMLGRTNRIVGWQDAEALVPNPPLGPNDQWVRQSVGCSWDEVRVFSECPSGYTLVRPGRNLRRHTVGANDEVTVGEWRADRPLECQSITTSTQQC